MEWIGRCIYTDMTTTERQAASKESLQTLSPPNVAWEKLHEDKGSKHQDTTRQMKIWSKWLTVVWVLFRRKYVQSQGLSAAKHLEASTASENNCYVPSFVLCFSLPSLFQLLIAGDINLQSKQTYSKYKIVIKAVLCITF